MSHPPLRDPILPPHKKILVTVGEGKLDCYLKYGLWTHPTYHRQTASRLSWLFLQDVTFVTDGQTDRQTATTTTELDRQDEVAYTTERRGLKLSLIEDRGHTDRVTIPRRNQHFAAARLAALARS